MGCKKSKRLPSELIEKIQEYVHRKEMNHSKAFYAIIASVLPDYKARMRLLKQN